MVESLVAVVVSHVTQYALFVVGDAGDVQAVQPRRVELYRFVEVYAEFVLHVHSWSLLVGKSTESGGFRDHVCWTGIAS